MDRLFRLFQCGSFLFPIKDYTFQKKIDCHFRILSHFLTIRTTQPGLASVRGRSSVIQGLPALML